MIGFGTPEQARAFREATGWQGALLTDPDGAAYRAAALRRSGWLRHLRWSVIRGYFAARRQGHRAGKVVGDPWQQGGTFVVAPPGRIAYAWRDVVGTEPAPYDEVLAALRAAAHPPM